MKFAAAIILTIYAAAVPALAVPRPTFASTDSLSILGENQDDLTDRVVLPVAKRQLGKKKTTTGGTTDSKKKKPETDGTPTDADTTTSKKKKTTGTDDTTGADPTTSKKKKPAGTDDTTTGGSGTDKTKAGSTGGLVSKKQPKAKETVIDVATLKAPTEEAATCSAKNTFCKDCKGAFDRALKKIAAIKKKHSASKDTKTTGKGTGATDDTTAGTGKKSKGTGTSGTAKKDTTAAKKKTKPDAATPAVEKRGLIVKRAIPRTKVLDEMDATAYASRMVTVTGVNGCTSVHVFCNSGGLVIGGHASPGGERHVANSIETIINARGCTSVSKIKIWAPDAATANLMAHRLRHVRARRVSSSIYEMLDGDDEWHTFDGRASDETVDHYIEG